MSGILTEAQPYAQFEALPGNRNSGEEAGSRGTPGRGPQGRASAGGGPGVGELGSSGSVDAQSYMGLK